MILKNYTYLAHKSRIEFYDSNQRTELIKYFNKIVLFNISHDFMHYLEDFCSNL